MAKVKSFSEKMVRDLSRVIDFYYWKGIPVARCWPRKTTIPTSLAMLSSQNAFRQSRVDLKAVSGFVRKVWADSTVGKRQAWLDYYTSIFLSIWKSQGRFPSVLHDFSIFKE
jgi:hypothetical protein